jgi:hypothetical protein
MNMWLTTSTAPGNATQRHATHTENEDSANSSNEESNWRTADAVSHHKTNPRCRASIRRHVSHEYLIILVIRNQKGMCLDSAIVNHVVFSVFSQGCD